MDNILNDSTCKDCKYRISRIISTEGLELVDNYGNDITDDVQELYHDVCTKLDLELDHIVIKCPLYKSKYKISDYFFCNKKILNLTLFG